MKFFFTNLIKKIAFARALKKNRPNYRLIAPQKNYMSQAYNPVFTHILSQALPYHTFGFLVGLAEEPIDLSQSNCSILFDNIDPACRISNGRGLIDIGEILQKNWEPSDRVWFSSACCI